MTVPEGVNETPQQATRDGLAAAVAAGRTLGRLPGPPPPTQEQDELAQYLRATGRPVTEIADLIGVARSKMYRALPDRDESPERRRNP